MPASMPRFSLWIASSATDSRSMDPTLGVMRSIPLHMRSDTNRPIQQTRPLIAEIPTLTFAKISLSRELGSRHSWAAGTLGLGKLSGAGQLAEFLASILVFHFPR